MQVEPFAPFKKVTTGNTVSLTGVLTTSQAEPILLLQDLARVSPPPSPALAFYSFDEEQGEVATDASGNEQSANLVNGIQHVAGQQGRAIQLDGEKSHVQLPDLGLQTALTISAWVQLSSYGKDSLASSILHSDGWGWGDLHFMVGKDTGRIRVAVNAIGDIESKFGFKPEQFGQWVHVALTYDAKASSMALYVNGQLDTRVSTNSPRPINLTHARLGAWDGHARMWHGLLDEVRFYDRALPEEDIGRLYRR